MKPVWSRVIKMLGRVVIFIVKVFTGNLKNKDNETKK